PTRSLSDPVQSTVAQQADVSVSEPLGHELGLDVTEVAEPAATIERGLADQPPVDTTDPVI
ncbi:hypothetical protein, partial [Klebsiella pneumoniae]|uniref:hypothetical protein n=1 Tax=Klebsiella pneumoniae TaxID=573 RepID=UPI0027301BED